MQPSLLPLSVILLRVLAMLLILFELTQLLLSLCWPLCGTVWSGNLFLIHTLNGVYCRWNSDTRIGKYRTQSRTYSWHLLPMVIGLYDW